MCSNVFALPVKGIAFLSRDQSWLFPSGSKYGEKESERSKYQRFPAGRSRRNLSPMYAAIAHIMKRKKMITKKAWVGSCSGFKCQEKRSQHADQPSCLTPTVKKSRQHEIRIGAADKTVPSLVLLISESSCESLGVGGDF